MWRVLALAVAIVATMLVPIIGAGPPPAFAVPATDVAATSNLISNIGNVTEVIQAADAGACITWSWDVIDEATVSRLAMHLLMSRSGAPPGPLTAAVVNTYLSRSGQVMGRADNLGVPLTAYITQMKETPTGARAGGY